jgi:hypothetical protein
MSRPCSRALDALGDQRALAALEPHLKTCDACRALVATHATLATAPLPVLDANAARRMRDTAVAELTGAPRAAPWWLGAIPFAAVTLGVGAAGALSGPRANLASGQRQVAVGALLAVAVLSACWAALSPRRRGRGLAFAVAFTAAAAVVFGGSGIYPAFCGPFWEAGLGCARAVVSWSVPGCAAALLAQRGAAHSLPRALLAGLAAGAGGALALHPHCPIGQALHLTVFHVLPWFAVAAALVLVQRRLRPRSFAP